MTTNSKARTALGKYRRRSADYWIDEPWAKRIKSGVRKQIENYRIIDTNNNFSDLSDMMEVQTLSIQELRAAMEGNNYSVFITKNLQKMSTKSNTLRQDNTSKASHSQLTNCQIPENMNTINQLFDEVVDGSDTPTHSDGKKKSKIPSSCPHHIIQQIQEQEITRLHTNARKTMEGKNFTPTQRILVEEIFGVLDSLATRSLQTVEETVPLNSESNIFLITGGPGTGKSFSIATTTHLVQAFEVGKCIKSSFMGVAAVPIDGNTIQNTFQINTIPSEEATFLAPLSPKQLAQLRLELGLDTNQFCVLIINEISTCTPTLPGAVDARLQQASGSLKRFGGLPVLVFGDFNQLPPVKGNGLASAAVDVAIYDVSNKIK